MRLDRLPDHGLVLLGSPDQEERLALWAEVEGIDYVVRDIIEPGTAYILNCDAFRADFPEEA